DSPHFPAIPLTSTFFGEDALLANFRSAWWKVPRDPPFTGVTPAGTIPLPITSFPSEQDQFKSLTRLPSGNSFYLARPLVNTSRPPASGGEIVQIFPQNNFAGLQPASVAVAQMPDTCAIYVQCDPVSVGGTAGLTFYAITQ